jgi:hypothetical protein
VREQAVEDPVDLSLKAKAVSIDHLLTHFPKNPYCSACQRAKVQSKPAMRQGPPDEDERPQNFGDQVTADHMIVAQGGNPLEAGPGGENVALVVLDRATNWIGAYPQKGKNADETYQSLQHFAGPRAAIS